MIAFFPEIYPDELLYSQIARYHSKSGYSRLIFTMTDIYKNGSLTLPSIEFVNQYTDDAMKWLSKNESWEKIVEQHTMYPAYIRFLPKTRRVSAVKGILSCNGNWKKLMCLPTNNEKRYMRYCPICAKEDREKYGETYWHREHQISRICVCSRHKCFLENSDIVVSSKSSPGLYDAESCVSEKHETRLCEDEKELTFTQYVIEVLREPMGAENDFCIGSFLHSQLGSEYVSPSGLVRNISQLYEDYCTFYGADLPIMSQSYMQKIYNGYAFDTYYILQIAYFLGISTQEITHLPNDISESTLHEVYRQLSQKHHLNYDIVEDIASAVLKYSHPKHIIAQKSGPRATLYNKLDQKYLPQVCQIVHSIIEADGRPQKLSIAKVQKALNLPQKQINKLPKCRSYIERYMESQEAFWAREVEWAVSVLNEENKPINCSRIMKMTNMRLRDIECCCQYIKNEAIKDLVLSLLNHSLG